MKLYNYLNRWNLIRLMNVAAKISKWFIYCLVSDEMIQKFFFGFTSGCFIGFILHWWFKKPLTNRSKNMQSENLVITSIFITFSSPFTTQIMLAFRMWRKALHRIYLKTSLMKWFYVLMMIWKWVKAKQWHK